MSVEGTTFLTGRLSWASATRQPVDKISLWDLGLKFEASTFELRF